MKRTSAITLVTVAFIGGAVGWLVQLGLAASGRPIIAVPLTLPLALAAIGVIVVLLARPIRNMTRGTAAAPVDPFFATRVVMLAKASAISGGLITGAGLGMLGYLLSRAVTPSIGSLAPPIAAIVGAATLLTCGLIAEYMCRIPPRDDEDDDDGDTPVRVQA